MKLITSGVLLVLFAVSLTQCDAMGSCCCQKGATSCKEQSYTGQHVKLHSPLRDIRRKDGFDYYQYLAFGKHIKRPIKMTDVCFSVTCADAYRVITYDWHFRKIASYSAFINFDQLVHYTSPHIICLTDPEYHMYFKNPICLPRVRYVRVLVRPKKFKGPAAGAVAGGDVAAQSPLSTHPVCEAAVITDGFMKGCLNPVRRRLNRWWW